MNTIPTVDHIHELTTQLQHSIDHQHSSSSLAHDDGSFNEHDDSHNSSNSNHNHDSQHDNNNNNSDNSNSNNISNFISHTTSSANTNSTDMNKLNLRLKEMFKERITKFRESVYLLTGFKVLYCRDRLYIVCDTCRIIL